MDRVTKMKGMWSSSSVFILAFLASCAQAQEECPSCQPGVIAGAVLGTLAFCIIVGVIIFFCLRRKRQREDAAAGNDVKKSVSGHTNAAYARENVELGSMSTRRPTVPENVFYTNKGFGGYVECSEYVSPVKDTMRNP